MAHPRGPQLKPSCVTGEEARTPAVRPSLCTAACVQAQDGVCTHHLAVNSPLASYHLTLNRGSLLMLVVEHSLISFF